MDNSADREALLNPVYQNLLTTAMTDGIIEYFQSRPVLAAAQIPPSPCRRRSLHRLRSRRCRRIPACRFMGGAGLPQYKRLFVPDVPIIAERNV